MQTAKANAANAQAAASGAQRSMREKEELVDAAKRRVEELSNQLRVARQELANTNREAAKASAAATEAKANANRNKRRLENIRRSRHMKRWFIRFVQSHSVRDKRECNVIYIYRCVHDWTRKQRRQGYSIRLNRCKSINDKKLIYANLKNKGKGCSLIVLFSTSWYVKGYYVNDLLSCGRFQSRSLTFTWKPWLTHTKVSLCFSELDPF